MKTIAQALNLQPDASETSCLSAIDDLRKRIDPAVHQQTLATLAAQTAELETLKAVGRKEKVDALLEGALTAKKITPAQRETFSALCATDDGLVQVTALLGTMTAALTPSGLDDKTPPGGTATLSAVDRAIIKEMGLDEAEYRKANGLEAV